MKSWKKKRTLDKNIGNVNKVWTLVNNILVSVNCDKCIILIIIIIGESGCGVYGNSLYCLCYFSLNLNCYNFF